jgi:uncharacterized membrane protein YiaA
MYGTVVINYIKIYKALSGLLWKVIILFVPAYSGVSPLSPKGYFFAVLRRNSV